MAFLPALFAGGAGAAGAGAGAAGAGAGAAGAGAGASAGASPLAAIGGAQAEIGKLADLSNPTAALLKPSPNQSITPLRPAQISPVPQANLLSFLQQFQGPSAGGPAPQLNPLFPRN